VFQKQSMLVRQLEEELRMRMRGPNMELQQQVELLLNENDHLTREVAILRETIKVNCMTETIQNVYFFISHRVGDNNRNNNVMFISTDRN
jgi:regulator of replication initiation timing